MKKSDPFKDRITDLENEMLGALKEVIDIASHRIKIIASGARETAELIDFDIARAREIAEHMTAQGAKSYEIIDAVVAEGINPLSVVFTTAAEDRQRADNDLRAALAAMPKDARKHLGALLKEFEQRIRDNKEQG